MPYTGLRIHGKAFKPPQNSSCTTCRITIQPLQIIWRALRAAGSQDRCADSQHLRCLGAVRSMPQKPGDLECLGEDLM